MSAELTIETPSIDNLPIGTLVDALVKCQLGNEIDKLREMLAVTKLVKRTVFDGEFKDAKALRLKTIAASKIIKSESTSDVIESDDTKCSAITKSGTRCARKAYVGGKCTQHSQ